MQHKQLKQKNEWTLLRSKYVKSNNKEIYSLMYELSKCKSMFKDEITDEMQQEALATLTKVKKCFSKLKPEKKYVSTRGGHYSYMQRIMLSKKYIMEGNYWYCCHELLDVFELEPVLQSRIICAINALLADISID